MFKVQFILQEECLPLFLFVHLLLFPVMSKKQARRVDTDNAKVDDAKAAKIKEREEERASKKKIKAKSAELLVCFTKKN